ncbi:unnamed protein product, partial [marine sediment metagenome]
QGSGAVSPYEGCKVVTSGVVTALSADGFYLQDPKGDGDDATSDAIFVHTETPPTVKVGDGVQVRGSVTELTPKGHHKDFLPLTQLRTCSEVKVLSSGNPLPAAVILGQNGRPIPKGDLDGAIDTFESLEGMRVKIEDAVVIKPSDDGGSFAVLGDNGRGMTGRTRRGGLVL